MAEKFGDRIVLVRRLPGGAAYARTSELQAAAVKGLLLQTSLSSEQSTEKSHNTQIWIHFYGDSIA